MIKKLLLILFATVLLVACGNEDLIDEGQTEDRDINEMEEVNETDEAENEQEVESEDIAEEENESSEDDVPREHRNALRAAQNYIDMMSFSEKGLFEQLTSEYGDQYPEDAAQYAIENVEVDYHEEALEAAISYQEIMPMSDQELLDQLTSEYGDQFTQEQAQYALDHLPN